MGSIHKYRSKRKRVSKEKTVLVLDIDKTICDSRSADHLLPTKDTRNYGAYQQWHQFTAETNFPEVDGARGGIIWLKESLDPDQFLFLTARSENLREPTVAWLKEHVGDLIPQFELSMRHIDDLTSGFNSKYNRMIDYRARHPDAGTFIFCDDEPSGLGLAIGKRDSFVWVKNCSWEDLIIGLHAQCPVKT